MKKLFLLVFPVLLFVACTEKKTGLTAEEAKELSKEAYVYAFPAVEHNKIFHKLLIEEKIPLNRFFLFSRLMTPKDTAVVSVNNDTYYCTAILDIRNEPAVISIPKVQNRFFCLQMVDIFTNCPNYVSSTATGEGPGNYLIVPTDWKGKTPPNISKVIKQPAKLLLIAGRLQVFDASDKEAKVLGDQFKITTLSQFSNQTAPKGEPLKWLEKSFDSKTADTESFYNMFNYMIQYQILDADNQNMMKKFAPIGLGVNKKINKSEFTPEVWSAIEEGAKEGKAAIQAKLSSIGQKINGWDISPKNAGRWGTDYLTNAAAAWKYIYVNTANEAIYPNANVDADGNPLDASKNNYTLTFSKEQIPQVKFFWSLTMYNQSGFFVENVLNRYNIKNYNKVSYNKDGSLTIYIQKENPGKDKEGNWLPAPNGQFYMILRLYGPSDNALSGKLDLPAVIKTK